MTKCENVRKAMEELESIGAPVIDNDWGGEFQISAESNDEITWASSYCSGGDLDEFGINHKINKILNTYKLEAHWYNAGVLCIYHQ